jgi:hypothetical protein
MLRITGYDRPQEVSFLVEGRLVGLWVEALEKFCEAVSAAEPSGAVVVTLALSVVDSEGRKLLTRMRRKGARLEPAGFMMKAIIKQIEAEVGKAQQA